MHFYNKLTQNNRDLIKTRSFKSFRSFSTYLWHLFVLAQKSNILHKMQEENLREARSTKTPAKKEANLDWPASSEIGRVTEISWPRSRAKRSFFRICGKKEKEECQLQHNALTSRCDEHRNTLQLHTTIERLFMSTRHNVHVACCESSILEHIKSLMFDIRRCG